MLKKLDPLLHSELRLSVMSLLISFSKADFTYLKEQTKATSGNLSVQITNLEQAGYITVEKSFKGKMPQTRCSITKKGVEAFEQYVNDLKEYLKI
ncbi:MAG: transcriptional regulator [Bacteroidetes bacterium GWF2_40_14]|nr:MAG: transcriptional regulator [Bacteroidetes bacterium GWF2_40_14]